ncbi:Tudor domain-containing protein 5 [Branchiostoma belcheri]|nr:Tudor domain-containing protein 5 [Branchiostoma belcheri]
MSRCHVTGCIQEAEFLHLPIQAVGARLANIIPNSLDNHWSSGARDRLLSLTRDKPLVALVTHIKDRVLSLCPCDTTTEQDIHINDTLVSEGHAILSPDLWSLSAEGNQLLSTTTLKQSRPILHSKDPLPGNQLYNATSGHFLVVPTGHGHPTQQPDDGIRTSDLDLGASAQRTCGVWNDTTRAPNGDLTSAGASQPVNQDSITLPSTNQQAGGVSQLQDLQDVVMPGMIGSIYPSLFPTFPHLSQGTLSQAAHLDMSCLSDRREAAGEENPPGPGEETSRQAEEESLQQACEELNLEAEPPKPRHIKQVQLTEEHHVSIIKYQDKPYIISGEISAFFWDSDLLRSMLRQKKLVMPKEVVTSDLCPELFEDLQRLKVTGISEGDSLRSHLTIYELQCVPDILSAFEHSSLELADRIQEEFNNFDPDHPYWKTHSADSTDQKRILHEMVNSPGASSVDELNTVELQMTDVRNRIKRKEQEETEDELSASFRPLGFQASTHDEVVQRCVDQQYQSQTQTRGQADTETSGHTDKAVKGAQANEELKPDKTGGNWSNWKEVETTEKKDKGPENQGGPSQACTAQSTGRRPQCLARWQGR